MLQRKAIKKMEEWLQSDGKTALLVDGARQTGKTTLIRAFAKKHFKQLAEINFLTMPDAMDVFSGSLDADTIIERLSAFLQKPLPKGKTLVFLDEIQECPSARTAIKFLVDDGRFRYVESGSLLGISYKEVPSYPVGYESELVMYPLDLEEYFLANGISDSLISRLLACYGSGKAVDPVVHETLKKLFFTYLVVGGMPAAVQEYVDSHDIGAVVQIQRDILNLYRQDIVRYAPEKEKENIRRIFDLIGPELNSRNRRFVLSDLKASARMRELESDFLWLRDAGCALCCCNVTSPEAPLKLNERSSLLRLFQSDVGLLCGSCLENIQFPLLNGDVSVNMGSILENFFAQEFSAHGFELYFYNRPGVGELDFVLQKGSTVLPVEVKSGADFRTHASLNRALAMKEWKLKQGIVFCSDNIRQDGKVLYLPWYLSMFLKQDEMPRGTIYQVDLSGLGV